jgi:hypothetical protein
MWCCDPGAALIHYHRPAPGFNIVTQTIVRKCRKTDALQRRLRAPFRVRPGTAMPEERLGAFPIAKRAVIGMK